MAVFETLFRKANCRDLRCSSANRRAFSIATETCPAAAKGELAFVGAAACAKCHEDAAAFWTQTKHARAYRTLVTVEKQFSLDCVRCHVTPAKDAMGHDKMGPDLYTAVCGICHEAEHRATMVPDLHVFKHPDTRDYWNQIIADGKLNSLMPAFSFKSGGILNEQQISSLVDYLMSDYVKETNAAPHASITPLPVSASPQAKAATARGSALGPFPVK